MSFEQFEPQHQNLESLCSPGSQFREFSRTAGCFDASFVLDNDWVCDGNELDDDLYFLNKKRNVRLVFSHGWHSEPYSLEDILNEGLPFDISDSFTHKTFTESRNGALFKTGNLVIESELHGNGVLMAACMAIAISDSWFRLNAFTNNARVPLLDFASWMEPVFDRFELTPSLTVLNSLVLNPPVPVGILEKWELVCIPDEQKMLKYASADCIALKYWKEGRAIFEKMLQEVALSVSPHKAVEIARTVSDYFYTEKAEVKSCLLAVFHYADELSTFNSLARSKGFHPVHCERLAVLRDGIETIVR